MLPFFLDGYGPSYNLGSCYSRQEVGKERPLAISATVLASGSAAVVGHLGLFLGRKIEGAV